MSKGQILRYLLIALAVTAAGWGVGAYFRTVQELMSFPGPFASAGFYEQAFAGVASESIRPEPGVTGILVNHHLLAPQLIARALSHAASDEEVTVVLIAPDHFDAGAAPMTTVSAYWPTPFGTIGPDIDASEVLTGTGYVLVQPEPFHREHGVTNLTAFIRRLMPDALLVPLIVKNGAPEQAVAAVADALAALPEQVLFIGSFDFTHDATMAQAETNDARSIPIIRSLDAGRVSEVAVDSHAGLDLFLRVMRARGAEVFTFLDSTNSARITGNHDQTDVTSYITGLFTR